MIRSWPLWATCPGWSCSQGSPCLAGTCGGTRWKAPSWTSGHTTLAPNRGWSLLTGRLVNLRRAACAGLRRFRLFLHSRSGLLFRWTAPAHRRLIRLWCFLVLGRSRSLLSALIFGLDARKVDYLAGRRGSVSPIPGITDCSCMVGSA